MDTLKDITSILAQNKNFYAEKYGVKNFGIFGSYSRGDFSETSDLDIMVEFDRPIGLTFVDLALDLESLLKVKVDLVSKKAIKPRMLKMIERELIYV